MWDCFQTLLPGEHSTNIAYALRPKRVGQWPPHIQFMLFTDRVQRRVGRMASSLGSVEEDPIRAYFQQPIISGASARQCLFWNGELLTSLARIRHELLTSLARIRHVHRMNAKYHISTNNMKVIKKERQFFNF
ncbi:uncharacterized protein [Physcomitrium patens]|uniref:uncharacterized protein isoform X2 n=1 Tax=Physcomitrium patens TaxID=3218 RepID=UPI003CCDD79D